MLILEKGYQTPACLSFQKHHSHAKYRPHARGTFAHAAAFFRPVSFCQAHGSNIERALSFRSSDVQNKYYKLLSDWEISSPWQQNIISPGLLLLSAANRCKTNFTMVFGILNIKAGIPSQFYFFIAMEPKQAYASHFTQIQ